MKQKKQQSLIFVRVIATFLFTLFKVEINFSLQRFRVGRTEVPSSLEFP